MPLDEKKQYIGDGVYVKSDGHHVILMTNNPDNPDNIIYLDSTTAVNLIDYLERIFGFGGYDEGYQDGYNEGTES